MHKPYANPKGKKSKEQVLDSMYEREDLTSGTPASRAHGWYGKKGSPHAIVDDFIQREKARKDDGTSGVDSVSLPAPLF
ncbi:MAG TPA: hypothetical protein VKQ30_20860 [Ktedonobacterales bacterium]|nr:hypothetical protein [Ktedonobacterales bacterium]